MAKGSKSAQAQFNQIVAQSQAAGRGPRIPPQGPIDQRGTNPRMPRIKTLLGQLDGLKQAVLDAPRGPAKNAAEARLGAVQAELERLNTEPK